MSADKPAHHTPEHEQKVVVVGQGYVGLPVAMRAVEVGYRVVGLDTDGVRVAGLQAGSSYVDDVCDETVRRHRYRSIRRIDPL